MMLQQGLADLHIVDMLHRMGKTPVITVHGCYTGCHVSYGHKI